MADNFNLGTPELSDIVQASGFNPAHNAAVLEDVIASQTSKQKQQEQLITEAAERIKQLKLGTKQKEEASALGVNPELKDYVTVDVAVAMLKANGVKDDVVESFVAELGDTQVVSRQALQAVILKRGGSGGSLALVGAKEGQPMQDEETGKWVRTWTKRTPELGILMTDRVSPVGVAVFQAEDPEGYAAGHVIESIQGPKLEATQTTATAKKTLAEGRVKQYKIDNWLKLDKEVNPYTKSGAGALARSGVANQRADRAFGLLALPKPTWQDIEGIKTDIAGILTGGVPQLPTLEDQGLANNVWQKFGQLKEFFTGARAEDVVPDKIREQMFERLKEIKDIDNEIIGKNIRVTELAAKDIIDTDRPRWEELKQVLLETTTKSDKEDLAYKAIFGGEGPVATPAAASAEPSTAVAPAVGARKSAGGHHYTVSEK